MKLAEALRIVQQPTTADAEQTSVYLACGFMPLHLITFLEANLRQLLPHKAAKIETGIYGDLSGNLDRLNKGDASDLVVVFEWSDFDPRLGLRSLGGWGPESLPDIVSDVRSSTARFLELIQLAAKSRVVVVSLPTLPLPPISYQANEQASIWQLQVWDMIGGLAVELAGIANVRVLNRQQLDKASPLSERLDVKSDFTSGFPYSLKHASTLAQMLATLVRLPQPKKGLITDLDDTLWRGLVGEDGVEGISWGLDQQSQSNALYQQTLAALAASGALVGVASKNDHALVMSALGRDDLIIRRDDLFPIEVSWQPKSESVRRILAVWNVNADSIVFVDDSPHEVAEVKAAFPTMECLVFPAGDDQAAYEFLEKLRNLFAKDAMSAEDAIRQESIRRSSELHDAARHSAYSHDEFLQNLEAEITLTLTNEIVDARALELINKTNQFNLNGRRLTSAEFQTMLLRPNAFLLVTSYKDKYGPLGRIAVMLGTQNEQQVDVDVWVMSCRAFSRRIEHKILEYLFDKFGVSEINFAFESTERNSPLQEFFHSVAGQVPQQEFRIDRETFFSNKPALQQRVKELAYA